LLKDTVEGKKGPVILIGKKLIRIFLLRENKKGKCGSPPVFCDWGFAGKEKKRNKINKY
jgi:hypothetical protein